MWSLIACNASSPLGAAIDVHVEATLSATNALRAEVVWTGVDSQEPVWIEHAGGTTPPTTEARATLLGVPPDADVAFRLVNARGTLAEGSVRTGTLPAALTHFDVQGPGFGDGYVVTTFCALDCEQPWAVAFDGDGAVRWYEDLRPYVEDAARVAQHPLPWAVRTAPGVLWVGLTGWETGFLKLAFSGESSTFPAPGGHHDFDVLDDESLAYTRTVRQDVDGEQVSGDELVLLDQDGGERIVWNAFDTLSVTRHSGWDAYSDARADWTHANGVDFDEGSGTWALSLYWLHDIVLVDGATGAVRTVLHGDDASSGFGPQHSTAWSPEGLWVFDNGSGESRAARLDGSGRITRSVPAGERLYTPVLGDVTPMLDERVLVTSGMIPELAVIDADGGTLLRVHNEEPVEIGQAEWVPSLDR